VVQKQKPRDIIPGLRYFACGFGASKLIADGDTTKIFRKLLAEVKSRSKARPNAVTHAGRACDQPPSAYQLKLLFWKGST
jgi:hypothetical protein